ncbi:hypothetical protein F5J12DRAFT_785189 [Pisolithus orientalis]|uniref:uncharacterized protein n=1 Tax=Pisolithus orientalis TaxID=936130 RepID=UPI002225707B|nr:uncharacterized protein F5J12DRAFT_785189 [Pisolithus orientalis]KAI5997245.1 hypothetical protein F5J12DRAFT_785189 [Pisolithus orientalis]
MGLPSLPRDPELEVYGLAMYPRTSLTPRGQCYCCTVIATAILLIVDLPWPGSPELAESTSLLAPEYVINSSRTSHVGEHETVHRAGPTEWQPAVRAEDPKGSESKSPALTLDREAESDTGCTTFGYQRPRRKRAGNSAFLQRINRKLREPPQPPATGCVGGRSLDIIHFPRNALKHVPTSCQQDDFQRKQLQVFLPPPVLYAIRLRDGLQIFNQGSLQYERTRAAWVRQTVHVNVTRLEILGSKWKVYWTHLFLPSDVHGTIVSGGANEMGHCGYRCDDEGTDFWHQV